MKQPDENTAIHINMAHNDSIQQEILNMRLVLLMFFLSFVNKCHKKAKINNVLVHLLIFSYFPTLSVAFNTTPIGNY